jgi:Bacterial PH domain
VASGRGRAGAQQVYRGAGAAVAWWAWAVFAVAVLADIALRHHDHVSAVAAAVILAITGIMYACAWRPRVVAAPDGIRVVNPVRTHLIPWAAVLRVEVAQTLRVGYAIPGGGENSAPENTVHSWAVQTSPRAQARGELRARRAARRGVPEPGYARLPAAARAASQGSAAEFAARQLSERLGREQCSAAPGRAHLAEASPAAALPASPASALPGAPRATWAWAAIAAIAGPLVLLAALLLA